MAYTPTKQQELETLDQTIYKLGPNSYLGPWLAEVKAEVEQSIRSDFYPEVSLAVSRLLAANILADAQREADAIRERAAQAAAQAKFAAAKALAAARVPVGTAFRELERMEQALRES